MALVKDVALAALDEEDDAFGVSEVGLGVGVESGLDAACEAGDALVVGESEGVGGQGVVE